MSITRLQQARQMYAMGQRVAKTLDGSRPGYRGDGEYQGGYGYGGSKASSGGNKGTSNTGGAGNQDTGNTRDDYRANYSSKSIVKGGGTKKAGGGYNDAIVSGNRARASAKEFVQQLNNNNAIRAAQTGTKFTPYQGGARTTDYYNSNPLKNLFKAAIGFAIPGAGFLINKGGKLKDGIMSLNDKIQNSNFGRSTSLMDYLDMRKYGGYDERELARQNTMQSSRDLQAEIDSGVYDGFEKPTQTFSFDSSGMKPSNLNNLDLSKLEAADLNNIQSLLDASTSYLRKSFVPNNMPDNLGGMSTNQYPTEGILGIDVGQQDPAFENDLMAGLTKQQQKMLAGPQKMGKEYGNFSDQDILNNISPFNDPNDPATLQEVQNFYKT